MLTVLCQIFTENRSKMLTILCQIFTEKLYQGHSLLSFEDDGEKSYSLIRWFKNGSKNSINNYFFSIIVLIFAIISSNIGAVRTFVLIL